ncbi:MAG: N-acetyl-gamma-glutamyl-phosphate reductase [Chloroflexi bacterium]|nr:N-acetyl-gamma-glutamyl-phosphate reductase [Chloroflexota bacterium]
MSKTRVGIINVTGYAGVELARLLCQHPAVELTSITGRSAAGQKLGKVFPHLSRIDLTITPELGDVELAFSALPHKESAKECVPLLQRGVKVVDISADFRLKDPAVYPVWYGFTHPAPELLGEAVFGLPELYGAEIVATRLVANPGCYPTSAILALAPALKAGIVEPDVIIDSKSGVSGAGRTLSLGTHYSEVNEDVSAYGLEGHRHLSEIIQELNLLNSGKPVKTTFIPHLIPMTRGILTTAYASLLPGKISSGKQGKDQLLELYRDFYKRMPFTKVVDYPPHTKYTLSNNDCLIHPTTDYTGERLVVISCLDNLVKGAAGQAIENMNLMLGLPETLGLESPAVYP